MKFQAGRRTQRTVALANGHFILPGGRTEGVLHVVGDRIGHLGSTAEVSDIVDLGGRIVVPGFVDLHTHGAGGRTFNESSRDGWLAVISAHAAAGTTTLAATLATAAVGELVAALEVGTELFDQSVPGLAGIHLEGPYLSSAQRGAHGERWLRRPDDGSWDLLARFVPILRIVTLAAELPGAEPLIRELSSAGVLVSAGHSAATPEILHHAVAAGLSHVAHLWSGMSMLSKRGPWRQLGLLEAVLASDGLTAEVIADGVHAPAELVRIAYRCLGPDRMCLISDASAGTGLAKGSTFRMGSADGVVDEGVALTLDGAAFCGSTSFLSSVVQFCLTKVGLSLVDVVHMVATTPARLLGLESETGRIGPGLRADLVVLEADFSVSAVMQAGTWVKFLGRG